MQDLESRRIRMVGNHLSRRGIRDARILDAFRAVPREHFLPSTLHEFAYEDSPLPIGDGQTIPQPYIVAYTAAALGLNGNERLLEVGTGSGYAAAIFSRLVPEVFTIERLPSLASSAKERLAALGHANVHVTTGDGTLGWLAHAPYDAIAVAASGPAAPPSLLEQLAVGGRLVMPIGDDPNLQTLVRITRRPDQTFHEERLTGVRYVPLIGTEAWADEAASNGAPASAAKRTVRRRASSTSPTDAFVAHLPEAVERIDDIDATSIDALLDRVADARIVLLGEATHGTSEFYRMRARITRELITRRGFQFVAVEADWPDAARIDDYVLGGPRRSSLEFTPFERFPTWMWRNQEVVAFVEWLRAFNADNPARRVGFHGLDLYSMYTSMAAVLAYLDGIDTTAAAIARHRYGSLSPWEKDPAAYGRAVLAGRYQSCEEAVVTMLRDMLHKRVEYAAQDATRFFDAAENARLVADAERYYRAMYYGPVESWNLRDTHMFDTLRSLLGFYGPHAKGIVWEHNSHVGDASATEMGARGEHNVGQLVRTLPDVDAYIVGFGTDHGTVAAASRWDGPVQTMNVLPAREGSYEALFHACGVHAFTLALEEPHRRAIVDDLLAPRLERMIGVIYRPDTELQSHYVQATLPRQFDEYIWFDRTNAVKPLDRGKAPATVGLPDTYPFGL